MTLLTGPDGADPAMDLALGPALLSHAAAGGGSFLRIYQPQPTVALTGRDRLSPAISSAVESARRHGFTPVRRASGGRAAAYTAQAICIDHVEIAEGEFGNIKERFYRFGLLLAGALQNLGVDARVGEVPGEYCPGEYSVNGEGRIKLIGTAQRLVRHGWMVSSVIVVSDTAAVRGVLTDVYRDLALDWNPSTAGSVTDLAPAMDRAEVLSSVLAAYEREYVLVPGEWPESVLAEARRRAPDHRV
ncbi:lipoate--protein ligase family protein [Nakamurella silvestris]|nr:lipoate--protein ligase family protein [Nakamurella silvestris]